MAITFKMVIEANKREAARLATLEAGREIEAEAKYSEAVDLIQAAREAVKRINGELYLNVEHEAARWLLVDAIDGLDKAAHASREAVRVHREAAAKKKAASKE